MARAPFIAAFLCAVTALATAPAVNASGNAATDPDCLGTYSNAQTHPGTRLRFGIDPGLAGSVGSAQLPTVPDNPTQDMVALQALKPPRKQLVVRLNRLFWSDGAAGIAAFQKQANAYTRAGFEVELQVRYHPATGEAGNIPAWDAYVRKVVDAFGPNPGVVAMTITNEVNVTFSPNTSDGSYADADQALISGIEAAHDEAVKHHYRQLKFGFTYAYRFAPNGDAAFFQYLGQHGGRQFQDDLGFVGLDFYPGSVYPPVMAPGDTYATELAQAAGVVRDCFAPQAGIGARTPIWITENGVPTGVNSDAQQASALQQLVQAASAYARAFNITDYRWFNLRDANSSSPAQLVGATFTTDGLMTSGYARKPSFGVYRNLIAALGTPNPTPASPTKPIKGLTLRIRRRRG
jgi:hypothetical protein